MKSPTLCLPSTGDLAVTECRQWWWSIIEITEILFRMANATLRGHGNGNVDRGVHCAQPLCTWLSHQTMADTRQRDGRRRAAEAKCRSGGKWSADAKGTRCGTLNVVTTDKQRHLRRQKKANAKLRCTQVSGSRCTTNRRHTRRWLPAYANTAGKQSGLPTCIGARQWKCCVAGGGNGLAGHQGGTSTTTPPPLGHS